MSEDVAHKPVTPAEIIEKMETLFRNCDDGTVAMKLAEQIAKWRGLNMDMDTGEDTPQTMSTEDKGLLDTLAKEGNGNQGNSRRNRNRNGGSVRPPDPGEA